MDKECPEQPERLEHVIEALEQKKGSGIPIIECANGEQYLNLFHEDSYIQRIKELCRDLEEGETTSLEEHEHDVSFSHKTYEAACYAVGAAVDAAKLAQHAEKSFALVRPPGHHAGSHAEGGFCIFNNVAIAAEYLRQQGERVMIIDIDLHLGNGTLEYVEGKQDVYYFSINQRDIWPHVNPPDTENTENIFLPKGTLDEKYIRWLQRCLPAAIKQFSPVIIAVSAGFDTYGTDYADPKLRRALGGGMALTANSTKELWKILDGTLLPYFAVLEGGYDPLSVLAGVLSFVDKDE